MSGLCASRPVCARYRVLKRQSCKDGVCPLWPVEELSPTLPDHHRRKWEVFIGCVVSGCKTAPLEFPNSSHQNLRNRLYVIPTRNSAVTRRRVRSALVCPPAAGSARDELLADLKCFQMLKISQGFFFLMRWNPPLVYAFGKKKNIYFHDVCS